MAVLPRLLRGSMQRKGLSAHTPLSLSELLDKQRKMREGIKVRVMKRYGRLQVSTPESTP